MTRESFAAAWAANAEQDFDSDEMDSSASLAWTPNPANREYYDFASNIFSYYNGPRTANTESTDQVLTLSDPFAPYAPPTKR